MRESEIWFQRDADNQSNKIFNLQKKVDKYIKIIIF
jgi:hypothetical protein